MLENKAWKDLNDKERNDLLGRWGGCGECIHWNRTYNIFKGGDVGCINPSKRNCRIQIYDNGCEFFSRRQNNNIKEIK